MDVPHDTAAAAYSMKDGAGADALLSSLRQLALSASPTHLGISVRALLEHASVLENEDAPDDSQSLVQSLASNKAGIGPAELYVICDGSAPFSATLQSLVTFVTPAPYSLDTCVWMEAACLPRHASKMLVDTRKIMAEIGKVVVCVASLAQATVVKQSW